MFRYLAREYGFTAEEVGGLSLFQLNVYLTLDKDKHDTRNWTRVHSYEDILRVARQAGWKG